MNIPVTREALHRLGAGGAPSSAYHFYVWLLAIIGERPAGLLIPTADILARIVGMDLETLEVGRDFLVACRLLQVEHDPASGIYVLLPVIPEKDNRLPMLEAVVTREERQATSNPRAIPIAVRAPKEMPAAIRFGLAPAKVPVPVVVDDSLYKPRKLSRHRTLRDELLARFDTARNEKERLRAVADAWRACFRPPFNLAMLVVAMQKLGGGRTIIERLLPEMPKYPEHWLAQQTRVGDEQHGEKERRPKQTL